MSDNIVENKIEDNLQDLAIDSIRNGENIFLSGPGGVGKSWVINQVVTDNTIVCAPTGIAAVNVGGSTCHRTFGLPIGIPTTRDEFVFSNKVRQRFESTHIDRIILDEIGILRADYLDLIDRRLRNITGNRNKVFGGIQVVVVGDFAQLEPIISRPERDLYYEDYDTPFAFGSACWNTFKMVELTQVKRQSNKTQVSVLNSIRLDDYRSGAALKKIRQNVKPYDFNEKTVHLCCFKADADRINNYWYNRIGGDEFHYNAIVNGKWNESEKPVADQMKLKEGCRVVIKANSEDDTYVNGDRGFVVECQPEYIRVELDNGSVVPVYPFAWEKYEYEKNEDGEIEKVPVAQFEQMPVRLGWAITVHGSQGMTLDDVALDVGRGCFGHGQLYVALSRIRDLKNLSLVTPIRQSDLIVRQEVKDFYGIE